MDSNIQDNFNDKFNDLLNSSQYFMMNQTSDIIQENKFDNVVFLNKVTIQDTLSQVIDIAGNTNKIVDDKYMQIFITKEIYEENQDVLNSEDYLKNYKIVDDYSEVFSGFVRCDNYFILANSSIIEDKFNVYILFDNTKTNHKFEFYGLIKLGYLVNPRGYTDDEIKLFEEKNNFVLKEDVRQYIKKTSIIKYDKMLFHINLASSSSTSNKFEFLGEKLITNNKFLCKYKDAKSDLEYEQIKLDEDEYMKKLENGFLYLGSLKKQLILLNDEVYTKLDKKVYLLLNYSEETNINYSFSIWVNTYENKNFDEILEKYEKENEDITDNDIILYLKRENIYKTLKCMENIYIE